QVKRGVSEERAAEQLRRGGRRPSAPGHDVLDRHQLQAIAVDLIDEGLGAVRLDRGVQTRGVHVVLAHAADAGKVEAREQTYVLRGGRLVEVMEGGGRLPHARQGALV